MESVAVADASRHDEETVGGGNRDFLRHACVFFAIAFGISWTAWLVAAAVFGGGDAKRTAPVTVLH